MGDRTGPWTSGNDPEAQREAAYLDQQQMAAAERQRAEIDRLTSALSAAEERAKVAEREITETCMLVEIWPLKQLAAAYLESAQRAEAAEAKAATLAVRVEALEGALQYVASQEPSDATAVDVLAEYRHRRRRAIAALADQATPTTPDARLVAVVRAAHKLADAVHMDAGAARETGLLANDVDDALAALPPEMGDGRNATGSPNPTPERDPVEVMARARCGYPPGCTSLCTPCLDGARREIAALEAAGAKVIWREPTEQALVRACARQRPDAFGSRADQMRFDFQSLFDAAPTYGSGEGS